MAKARVLQTLCALAVVAIYGCSDSWHGTSPQAEEQNQNYTGTNILTSVFPSPKEQNPYSVENMSKTFKDLVLANNPNAKDIPELEANFLYVRFLPYGKQGVYELKTYDTALVLFNHPMDYNEIRKPAVYVDKTLPDSITPYFASVPVGYEFGPTPYEILQELFLTQPLEEDDEADGQEGSRFVRAKKSNKASKKIAAYLKSQGLAPYLLEKERFNAEAGIGTSKALAKNIPLDADNFGMDNIVAGWPWDWKRWRPGGTLTYYDNKFEKNMPLVGVRVTAGYSYYWRSSTTDSQGKFSNPDKWTFSVYYEAHFDANRFMLNDVESWYSAHLVYPRGGTTYSQWNYAFENERIIWCVIWTAAWNYLHGKDIGGLQRPRQSGWIGIDVYYKNNNGYNNSLACKFQSGCESSAGRYVPVWGYIMIRAYGKTHLQLYGTTIHELAHSSHDYNGRYLSSPGILKESYADGVSRYLTDKHYGTGAWNKGYTIGEYTGIFEDLEDADPTFTRTGEYCDRVSGITIPMAEKSLFKSSSWNAFKDSLMKDYPSGTVNNEGKTVTYTAADMNALFKYWRTEDGAAPCPVPVSDTRDKKVYETAVIGTQTWMTENLSYNAAGSKCYGNYAGNCDKYGRLYDWATALDLPSSCNSASCSGQVKEKHKGICPSGWHIPSMEDWNKLMRYVDNVNNTRSPYDSPTAGIHLKSISGWYSGWIGDIWYGGSGKDTYGFSALPGGYYSSTEGSFKSTGYNGGWWSAAEYDDGGTYRFDLYYGDKAGWSDIGGINRRFDKTNLYSIRCLKD
ncbi:MAG: hypothetical protein LBH25_10370 [Fibromonadaceae bacterium]|jgi:uncharacterized protein (TIGR02145 family)|nr:hypothetical protein [Fibromonadaceae bacterium]